MVEQLTLGIIIAAALADSINPCVFGVLIFLLAYMTSVFKSKTKMLIGGLAYISSVYLTYFLIGLGVFTLAYTAGFARPFYWIAAILAIGAGLFEIKDYFWYGRWFSLQMIPGGAGLIKKYSNSLRKMETKHPALSIGIAFFLGILVVFVELPCTGAPYLAVLGFLTSGEYSRGIPLLLLYNLIFILPLFFIVGLVYFGKTSRTLEKWRKENRGLMRLGIGLFLIVLGGYMIWSIIG
jgi:cytochrome c biogenesis protein CcdA|tara:strand:+ start:495 stop:1205 length:711 start_codon:yes stop_codon:yes gene_type:complete